MNCVMNIHILSVRVRVRVRVCAYVQIDARVLLLCVPACHYVCKKHYKNVYILTQWNVRFDNLTPNYYGSFSSGRPAGVCAVCAVWGG